MDGAALATKPAFDLTQRTVAPKIRQEPITIVEIQPYAQLLRVVTNNSVTTQTKPTYERIVCLDKPCIAQPQNRNVQRAGAKGRAEARLALAQPRLTPAQLLFGALAHCDVVTDGLNKLSAAELDGCKKHFDRHFGTVAAHYHPFETRTPFGPGVGDMLCSQRLGALAARLDRRGDFGGVFADHIFHTGIAQKL